MKVVYIGQDCNVCRADNFCSLIADGFHNEQMKFVGTMFCICDECELMFNLMLQGSVSKVMFHEFASCRIEAARRSPG